MSRIATLSKQRPEEKSYSFEKDFKRNFELGNARMQFNAGDTVKFTNNDKEITGIILSVNTKTCSIRTNTGDWKVSFKLLTKIDVAIDLKTPTFNVGDKVYFVNKGVRKEGVVIKNNNKRVKVFVDNKETWNCIPMTLKHI